jgi:hypothetical protein
MSEEIKPLRETLLEGIDWPKENESPEVYNWRVEQILTLVGVWLKQYRDQIMAKIHERSPD